MTLTHVNGRAQQWRSKYKAQPVVDPEHGRFDSKREHQRFHLLRMREKAGEIRNLERSPRFDMIVNGIKCGFYKADFAYFENNKRIIEDVKSEPTRTPVYRLKKRIVEALYGVQIVEVF
jgi:hypothetical protein